jgi:hypothetical protein
MSDKLSGEGFKAKAGRALRLERWTSFFFRSCIIELLPPRWRSR